LDPEGRVVHVIGKHPAGPGGPEDGAALGGGMRSGKPTPELFPGPESLRPTLLGSRYVVSAGHPLVAEVAGRVFDGGGNAVDAGVAAGLAAAVVQADMCNLGGVAPIMVRQPGADVVESVAGLGWWGEAATLDAYRARYGEEMPLGPPVGIVPAAVSAWVRALQRFGTWTFRDCAAPAIELAHDGFPVDRRLAAALEVTGCGFSRWPSSRAVYWPDGAPPRPGDTLVQDALGRLLERLADAERASTREAGLDAVHDAFYCGDIAQRIAAFSQQRGGWLAADDLAAFDAEIEPAVSRGFHDWEVFTPTTWCQGPALLQALAVLEGLDLSALGHNSADYVHTVAEAMKQAFFDRERHYGDPRHVEVPLERLLSDEHAGELRAQIDTAIAQESLSGGYGVPGGRVDTTYLCTVDAAGNAFSAMPSDTLDGSPIIPELGIIISPRGVQSRLEPGHPASIGPRKRPRLTPSPAIALRRPEPGGTDRRVMALGCPGGDVILQGMLQAFLNLTVFGMTAQQAVEAPRFACFAWPDSFYPHGEVPARVALEGRIGGSVADDLRTRGHDVRRWPEWEFDAGGVSVALDVRAPSGGRRVLATGADPRRINYALGR
jgi:gamma-glutamyltranspeptidase / glutathione hydrolase